MYTEIAKDNDIVAILHRGCEMFSIVFLHRGTYDADLVVETDSIVAFHRGMSIRC